MTRGRVKTQKSHGLNKSTFSVYACLIHCIHGTFNFLGKQWEAKKDERFSHWVSGNRALLSQTPLSSHTGGTFQDLSSLVAVHRIVFFKLLRLKSLIDSPHLPVSSLRLWYLRGIPMQKKNSALLISRMPSKQFSSIPHGAKPLQLSYN